MEGEQVFGAPADGQSIDEEVSSLEEKLAAVSVAPEGERVSVFQRLVASALNKSKALDQLLRVQKLDTYDIEGAILAYDKFMEMADNAGQLRFFLLCQVSCISCDCGRCWAAQRLESDFVILNVLGSFDGINCYRISFSSLNQ